MQPEARLAVVVGFLFALLSLAGVAGAQSGPRSQHPRGAAVPHNETGVTILEQRVEGQQAEINERIESIARAGAEMEEARARASGARAQAAELEAQSRELEGELAARRQSVKESAAAYREMVRGAYKGGEIEGLTAFLESLFSGEDSSTPVGDARASQVLFDGRESVEEYRESQNYLRGSVTQFDQSQAEVTQARKEEQSRVRDLTRRKAQLAEAISLLKVSKKRTQTQLQELRAQERAEIRAQRSASGEENMQAVRELGIARRSIVARPVEEISARAYLRLYKQYAREYGFAEDWYILAAVGKVESNHGENMGPSSAGALGPMQFIPSTWEFAGLDGNGDGIRNVLDPEDAIPAAAKYLKDGGAPGDWYAALYSYNHADWYVREVLAVAEGYRQLAEDDKVGPYTQISPAG